MASATKTYRLVCLENPLIGERPSNGLLAGAARGQQLSIQQLSMLALSALLLDPFYHSPSLAALTTATPDIQVYGDDALLGKYGLKVGVNDSILAGPEHDGLFQELVSAYKYNMVPGGAAQNTARGAQYMLAPGSVAFIGCVGDDGDAASLRDINTKAGLRSEYRVDPDLPTGRCAVVITGKHNEVRTMVTSSAPPTTTSSTTCNRPPSGPWSKPPGPTTSAATTLPVRSPPLSAPPHLPLPSP